MVTAEEDFRPSPELEQVVVHGAGTEAVNGTYSLVAIHKNRGLYQKLGFWEGNYRTFSLYRHRIVDGNTFWRWYISIIPAGKLPNCDYVADDFDIDFYFATESSADPTNLPPSYGWAVEEDEEVSVEPAPTVSPKDIVPFVPIMKPVASAYEELLLSGDFSDVKLVCRDQVVLPAHRCVLAASSSYFKAAFAGPWKENETGELKTNHNSSIIKDMLRMIYTGATNSAAIEGDPIAFIVVATEFDLPWLKEVAEKHCSESIDETNLKDIWQAARSYDSDMLKKRCIEYAKNNALSVLANGGMSTLQSEDPPSWDEFSSAINKKARHE